MSTTAQVTRLVQPYVDRHEDLALVKRIVFIQPVRHVLRGVYIDRSMWSGGTIRPSWYVRLMFNPWFGGSFDWSHQFIRANCDIDEPDARERLYGEMDAAFADILRPAETMESLGAVARRSFGTRGISDLQESLIVAAKGYFSHAVEGLTKYIAAEESRRRFELEGIHYHTREGSRPWQREMEAYRHGAVHLDRLGQLVDLLRSENRQAIGDLLREWEHETAKAWKIDKFWKPAPFPFEEHGAGQVIPTTATPAIVRWLGPILGRSHDIVLEHRNLVLKPVHHMLAGVRFDASWSGTWLQPGWYVRIMFSPPVVQNEFEISQRILSAESSQPDFERELVGSIATALETIRQFERIDDIFELVETEGYDREVRVPISDFGFIHRAIFLAALGRLDEAGDALGRDIQIGESHYTELFKRGRTMLKKLPDGRRGKNTIRYASEIQGRVAHQRSLLALVEARDRRGIGALLREWEQRNAKLWRVEHLWEPTPFPVEQGDH